MRFGDTYRLSFRQGKANPAAVPISEMNDSFSVLIINFLIRDHFKLFQTMIKVLNEKHYFVISKAQRRH